MFELLKFMKVGLKNLPEEADSKHLCLRLVVIWALKEYTVTKGQSEGEEYCFKEDGQGRIF